MTVKSTSELVHATLAYAAVSSLLDALQVPPLLPLALFLASVHLPACWFPSHYGSSQNSLKLKLNVNVFTAHVSRVSVSFSRSEPAGFG